MEEPCGDRNSTVCKGIEELGGAMRRKSEAMSGKGMAKNREDKQWQRKVWPSDGKAEKCYAKAERSKDSNGVARCGYAKEKRSRDKRRNSTTQNSAELQWKSGAVSSIAMAWHSNARRRKSKVQTSNGKAER